MNERTPLSPGRNQAVPFNTHATSSVYPMPDGRPAPWVMVEDDVIKFCRLDKVGLGEPRNTLRYYREKGTLKATRIRRGTVYTMPSVLEFLETLTNLTYERRQR